MKTLDKFLGGKVLLHQESLGLRATSDSVITAAAVQIKKNQTVLDIGAGNGVIALCLNARIPCKLTAIEIQKDLCSLIAQNATENSTHIQIIQHDILSNSDPIKGQLFDCVVTNPPFYDTTGKSRANSQQKRAYVADFSLSKWLNYSLKHLKSKGNFTIINTPENLAEILNILRKKLGKIEIIPIQSKINQPAKRIIVRGILGNKTPLRILPPLVMHDINGNRSEVSEQILRYGSAI